MKTLFAMSFVLLLAGCPPAEETLPPPPPTQPTRGPYRVDRVNSVIDRRESLVIWIENHPGAKIISVTTEGDYNTIIVYEPATTPQLF